MTNMKKEMTTKAQQKMAVEMSSKGASLVKLSQRLRGIAHAPADFDYKQELANRFEDLSGMTGDRYEVNPKVWTD